MIPNSLIDQENPQWYYENHGKVGYNPAKDYWLDDITVPFPDDSDEVNEQGDNDESIDKDLGQIQVGCGSVVPGTRRLLFLLRLVMVATIVNVYHIVRSCKSLILSYAILMP